MLTSPAQVQVPPLRTPSPNAFKRTVWTTPRGPHESPNASASSSSLAYGLQTLPHRHSRSFEDDGGLPYGLDDGGNGGGYPYYANDGDSNSYMFNPDQLVADRADSPSSSSSSLLLQSRQQGRRGGGENPESKPKYGSDDAAQLAYMEQMYNTIQVLNAELEKERQDRTRLHVASSIDGEIAAALEYPQVGDGGGGHPFVASDYFDDSSMNLLVESTPSTASGARRSRPLPSQQPKHPVPPPQNKALSKDQVELCATLGKNAELRIRTKEIEKSAEKASEQLDQAQKQMKMVERRISNREEKLRILMKEKLHWQKELKDMRDQVIEEKMRQVELFRRLETAKREGAAQMEQLEHDLRDVHDENQNLRAQVAEARAHITFQAKKLDDVVRQARDEKEKLVSCIAETRYKFKEWKEGEAAALRSSREQAVNNVKTEYDLKIARHQEEKQKLREKVKDLEVSLRLMQKDRTLSPLELSLRKATILGSKDNAGTSEAELIEAHSRIRELEAIMEHSQEYQKRQENIIKVSEATISRLVQEREVTALENLSAQPLAGGFMSPMFANDTGNNMFSSSIPNYSAASSPNVGTHRDVPKRQSYGNAKSPSSHDNSSSSYGKPRASSSNRIHPASSSPLLNSQYRNETGPAVQPPSLASASASSFSLMTSSPSKLSKASSAVETTLCHQNEEQVGEKLSDSQRQDTGIHVEPKARPELTLPESIREEADDGRATSLSIDKAEDVDKVQDQPESTATTTAPSKLVASSKEQFLADEVTRLQRELAELKANAASNKNARLTTPTMSDKAETNEAPPVESVSTADSVASDGGGIKAAAVDDGALDGDIIAEEIKEELGSDDDGKSCNKTITCELKEASAGDVQEKEHNDEAQQLEQQLPETANAQHPVNAVDENKLSGEEKSQPTEEAESKSSAVAEVSEAKDRDTAVPDEDDKESEARAPRVVEALEETVPVAAVNDRKDPTSVFDVTALVVSDTDSRGVELPAQDTPATQENEETSLDLRAEAGTSTGSDDAQTITEQVHEADAPKIMATEDSVSSASLSEVAATQEREKSSALSDVHVVDDLEADSNSVTRETRIDATESTIDDSKIADVNILAPAKNDVEDGKLEPSKTEDEPVADELKMGMVDATQNAQLDAKGVCDDEKGQAAAGEMADECCGDVCSIGAGESEVVDAKAQPEVIVEVVVPVQLADAKEDNEVAPGEEAFEKADVKITHASAASDTEEEAKTTRDQSPDGASDEDAKDVLTADSEAEVQLEPIATSTTPMQPTNTETESELVLGPEGTAEGVDGSVPASVQNEHDEVEKVTDNLDDAVSDEKANEVLPDASKAVAEPELVEVVRPDQVDDIEEDSELSPEPEVSSDAVMSIVVVDQLLDLNKEAVTAQADAVVSLAEKPETNESSVDGGSVSEADCDAVCDPPIARGEEDDGVFVQVEHSGDAGDTLFFNNGELCDCEIEKEQQEQQQEQQPSPADQQPDQRLSVVGLVASNMVVRVISKGLHHSIVLHLEHRKYIVKTFVLSVLKGAIQSTVTQLVESQGTSQKNLDEKQPEEPGAVEALSIDNGEQENESTGALADSDPAGASGAAQSSLAEQSKAVEDKPSAQADKLDVKPAENDASDVQLDSPVPASESLPIADEEAPAPTENAAVAQTEESTDVMREPPRDGGEDRTSDRQEQPSVMSQKQIESIALVDVPASTVEKQFIQTQSKGRDKGEELEAPTCPSEQQQISREEAVAAETVTGEGADAAAPIADSDDRGSIANDEDGDDATAFCSLGVSTFTKHFVLAVQHEAVASMLSNLCPQERIEELQESVVDDREVPKADLMAKNTLGSSIAVAEAPSALSILEPSLSMEETATLDQSPDHRVNPGDTDCEVSPPADILVITRDAENTEQPTEGDAVGSSLPDPPDSPAVQPDFSAVEFVIAVQQEAIAAVMKKSMEYNSTLESRDEAVTTSEHGGEVTDRCRMEEAPETLKEDGGIVSGAPCESPVLANLELIPTDKSPAEACDVTSDAEFEPSEGTFTSTPECCEKRGSEVVESCEPPAEPAQAVDALEREVVETVDEICHTVSDGKLETIGKLLESASALSADTVRDDEEVSIKSVILAAEQPKVCEKDDEKLDTELVVIGPTTVAAEAEMCLVTAVAHVSRQISLDATTAALEAYSAACTSEAASVAANHAAGGGAVDPVLDVPALAKCESISPGDDFDKVKTPETPAVDTGAEREVEPTEARTLSADSDHVSELDHASSDYQSEESRLLSVNAIPNYTSVGLLNSPHEEICNDESVIHETLEGVAIQLVVALKSCASTMNDVFGKDASTISAGAKVLDDPPAEESDTKTVDDALEACSQTLSEAVAVLAVTSVVIVESGDAVPASVFVNSTTQQNRQDEESALASATQGEDLSDDRTATIVSAGAEPEAVLKENSQAVDAVSTENGLVPASPSVLSADVDFDSGTSLPSEEATTTFAPEVVLDGVNNDPSELNGDGEDLEKTNSTEAPEASCEEPQSEETEASSDTSPDAAADKPTEMAEPPATSAPSEELTEPLGGTTNIKEAEATPAPEASSESDAVEVNAATPVQMDSINTEAASAPVVDVHVVEAQVAEFPASDNGETVSDAGPQILAIEGGADSSPDADAGKPDSSSVEPDGQIQDLSSETVETAVVVNKASGEANLAPALDPVLDGPPQEIANAVEPSHKDDTGIPETVPTAAATTAATDAVNKVTISLNPLSELLTTSLMPLWLDGEAQVTPVSHVRMAQPATDPDVHAALDAILDEVERSVTTAAVPIALAAEETEDRFGSRVTWSLPPEAESHRPASTPSPKSRRTERRRTSKRLLDQPRCASMEQMRDPTLAAYDAHREQGQPFALLDDTIFSIDPHARHMQYDENDNAKCSESEIRAKRKNFDQDNHRKSIAFRSIPAFNYAPLLIRFQWSDFVIATPISVCNPSTDLVDKKAWNPASPVKKMRLIAKKGIKLACGSYVIISAFIRPLEDGNENLRIHIYDSEWVEEFQYDFFEDHLKAYMHEWSGRDDEAKLFMTQLEFRREEGGIIIKLPDKIGGQGGEEADKRPATAPAVAMPLPDGKEHPHHDHTSPLASHRNSRHSHRPLPSLHGPFLSTQARSCSSLSDSSTRETHTNVDDSTV